MDATQPIGIFLPCLSRKSTQLCGFNIFNSFCYGLCTGSSLFSPSSPPLCFPLHPSFPSVIGWVVCWHRMCAVRIQGKGLYLTQFRRNSISRNPHKSRGFSPRYPQFLHQSLLSHRPLLCYYPPTVLSDYKSLLLSPHILPVHASSH